MCYEKKQYIFIFSSPVPRAFLYSLTIGIWDGPSQLHVQCRPLVLQNMRVEVDKKKGIQTGHTAGRKPGAQGKSKYFSLQLQVKFA